MITALKTGRLCLTSQQATVGTHARSVQPHSMHELNCDSRMAFRPPEAGKISARRPVFPADQSGRNRSLMTLPKRKNPGLHCGGRGSISLLELDRSCATETSFVFLFANDAQNVTIASIPNTVWLKS